MEHHDDDETAATSSTTAACDKPLAETAFRVEEKKYKLYKPVKVNRKLVQPPETDFSEVLDFRKLDQNLPHLRAMIKEVGGTDSNTENGNNKKIFTFTGLPGLVFLPNYLSTPTQQQYWVRRCMSDFTHPPHPNNETALDFEANKGKTGYRAGLRWATLGYSYNWTKKTYHPAEKSPFPDELAALCCEVVTQHFARSGNESAAHLAKGYEAQTAIVNYFPVGTQMCAHQDVSEAAMHRPLVSISFGCSAIFLMGTTSRDDKPFAMWLRSGDVVVFSGPCRDAFHAVPRIMDDCPDYLLQAGVGGLPGLRLNINVRQVFDDEHGVDMLKAPVAATLCSKAAAAGAAATQN